MLHAMLIVVGVRPELEAHVLQVLVDRAVAVDDAVHLEVDGEAGCVYMMASMSTSVATPPMTMRQ